ncbi:SEP domain-containing protein [Dichotomocladium elegans]|nr:SEP domain-containing protein [Dichotomocladium elegans]
MVVQGPNRDNDIVNQILKKAAERGSAPEELSPTSKKPEFFKGTGYKLGSEEEPSETVGTESVEEEDTDLQPVTRYLTFWRNGFSVDDGPLYRYDDPANQTMLTAINSGRAPLSLLNVRHGQPVDVRVARRQDEDYVAPPKAPPKPFEGAGHRLGSPLVASEGSSRASTPGAFPSASAAVSSPSTPAQTLTVDESQPMTQIQIRLGDGTRLVTKLNHTHTVGDIRRYIDANRPTNVPYILQTTFPVKELKDDRATLKEAGLMNTVIVQRYQ